MILWLHRYTLPSGELVSMHPLNFPVAPTRVDDDKDAHFLILIPDGSAGMEGTVFFVSLKDDAGQTIFSTVVEADGHGGWRRVVSEWR